MYPSQSISHLEIITLHLKVWNSPLPRRVGINWRTYKALSPQAVEDKEDVVQWYGADEVQEEPGSDIVLSQAVQQLRLLIWRVVGSVPFLETLSKPTRKQNFSSGKDQRDRAEGHGSTFLAGQYSYYSTPPILFSCYNIFIATNNVLKVLKVLSSEMDPAEIRLIR